MRDHFRSWSIGIVCAALSVAMVPLGTGFAVGFLMVGGCLIAAVELAPILKRRRGHRTEVLANSGGDLALAIEVGAVQFSRILRGPERKRWRWRPKAPLWVLTQPIYENGFQFRLGDVLIVNREPRAVSLGVKVAVEWSLNGKQLVHRVDAGDSCLMQIRSDVAEATGMKPHLRTPIRLDPGDSAAGHMEFPIIAPTAEVLFRTGATFTAFLNGKTFLEIKDHLSSKTARFAF